MSKGSAQKIKLLKLLELLQQETDEGHSMSTSDICGRLVEIGVEADRRTLGRDIAYLNQHGYEIMMVQEGRKKSYYVDDRSFSVPELKILIDAVQAASFITEKKTLGLIDKIAALGGSHRADILRENIVQFNTRKHSNEHVYYSVSMIEEAVQNDRKIIFRYYDLDENASKVYRRDGHHYVVEPVALVFYEDNYYLTAYSARHDGTANYRIDRMEGVEVIDDCISEKAITLRKTIGEFSEQAFRMYGGELVEVTLEFDDKLIGVVYDKFSEDTKIERLDRKCTATVKVQISPVFWGWLFQFVGQMKILAPDTVIKQYNEYKARLED